MSGTPVDWNALRVTQHEDFDQMDERGSVPDATGCADWGCELERGSSPPVIDLMAALKASLAQKAAR